MSMKHLVTVCILLLGALNGVHSEDEMSTVSTETMGTEEGQLHHGVSMEEGDTAVSAEGIELCWKCNVYSKATHGTSGYTAFKVRRRTETSLTYNGQILKFDEKAFDTHDSFNLDTGEFIPPSAGTYLFTLTVVSQPGKEARLRVMQGDTILGQCYTGKDTDWSSGSETMVVYLEPKDHVVVKNWDNWRSDVLGTGWTSFMGVRVS